MPPVLPPGSSLRSRYRIARVLDRSPFRNIYVAEDQHLKGRYWVVKEMQPLGVESGDRTRLLARFQAEALQISALDHPNLPKLVDFFSQEELLYLVREFVPGSDLLTVMKERRGPLSTDQALEIGIQLTDLLSYLWSRKFPPIIYREMVLSNLVLTPAGEVKLVDLGFARLFQGPGQRQMGSQDYAAPEQYAEEGGFDARTLVYNVGALVYHLLTGRNPGSSPFQLTPVRELRPEIPHHVAAVIERATRNDPGERYSSLKELRRALHGARAGKRGGARRLPLPSSPLWTWLLALVLLTAMAGALVVLARFLAEGVP